jgi:ribonuclease VapC
MVIVTSAVIAILLEETAADRLGRAIRAAPTRRMSAASVIQAGIVAQGRFREAGERNLDRLLSHLEVEIIPFTERHAKIARAAYRHFGRGNHPAKLNYGDCFAYALSQALDEPLLFVGDDFTQTDIDVAPY